MIAARIAPALVVVICAACGREETRVVATPAAPATLVEFGSPDPEKCPSGGVRIEVGRDDGADGGVLGDGVLAPGEIDRFTDICSAVVSDCSIEREDGGVVVRCRDGTVVHFADEGPVLDGGRDAPGNGARDAAPPDSARILPDAAEGAVAHCGDGGTLGSSEPTVSAGFGHSCALDSCGKVACWGGDFHGESTVPPGTFLSVSAGVGFTCSVRTDHTLACWGIGTSWGACDDFDEQCGQALPPLGQFESVGAGWHHGCGLTVDHEIRCWGAGGSGKKGVWDAGQSIEPTGQFSALSVGEDANCAVRQGDGSLVCWGTGASWSLPTGSFVAVAAHTDHGCALDGNAHVTCFGDDTDNQASPPGGAYVQTVAGGRFSCALSTLGLPVCWGLGTDDRTLPPQVSFTSIAVGRGHGCGWLESGGVRCWGADSSGQTAPPPALAR